MNLSAVLDSMKSKLAVVPGIKTIKVGIETNMAPTDYPIIRLVPSRITGGDPSHFRNCEVLVYFGINLLEAQVGLEAVLDRLMNMEQEIVDALSTGSGYKCSFIETLTSAGVVEHYELAVARFKVSFPS